MARRDGKNTTIRRATRKKTAARKRNATGPHDTDDHADRKLQRRRNREATKLLPAAERHAADVAEITTEVNRRRCGLNEYTR